MKKSCVVSATIDAHAEISLLLGEIFSAIYPLDQNKLVVPHADQVFQLVLSRRFVISLHFLDTWFIQTDEYYGGKLVILKADFLVRVRRIFS